ncbi:MAG: division/cell wall cluster transcriptional repressor MraZ [Oscillospiraceae bacterium]|jgi:MraZ protein|nr:division/cell wall cluster transcriptional repressor MraZ [Oscillospiraceae bacterium]
MLIGEYRHSVDIKGRVNFPVKLREDLGDRFIVTRGLDNCLFVYSLSEWKILDERIRAMPMSKSRGIQRFLFASACEVEPDKQGRILIPGHLRSHAGLEREVVVIGASSRAEIWDQARWEENCGSLTSDTMITAMDELGF